MATTSDPVRILVAEDSPTQAEKLKYTLEQHGYEVVVAQHGVHALSLLAEHKPVLVISDIVMPEMDGYELCRRIRAEKSTAHLPVVLLTSLADTKDVLESLACGANSFITKPYSQDYLLAQVAQTLSGSQQQGIPGPWEGGAVEWKEKRQVVSPEHQRAVNLLISTYEAAVQRNRELARTQDELQSLNERLEDRVAERTADLSDEIAVRRATERALRESEEKYRTLVDNAEEAVLVAQDGLLKFVSRRAMEMTGYSERELVDRSFAEFIYPDDREKVTIIYQHLLRKEPAPSRHAFRIVTVEGIAKWVETGQTLIEWKAEPAVLVLLTDITERLRGAEEKAVLEAQLRQSQKVEAIGSLAGGVAHDFNNITAIILGYGEMLLGRLLPGDPARRWAEQIVEAGRRSAALTRQLLAFSRKQTLQPEVFDLNALLRNLEKMLGQIGENIKLEFGLAGDLGRVTADPGQIEQVVLNLVVNARDAMPLGGSLRIETANVEFDDVHALGHPVVVPGRYVLLTLTDTGSGMDKATLGRLFEPFFTTKPVGKGTGLGLATVHGIVKQSGGHIRVASEPGQGTSFRIYLPRTDAVPAANAAAPAGETPRGGGELILLVEDEAPLREMVETVLSGLGYRVSAVGSGEGALALMAKEGLAPDLVLTDVVMPEMSGAELADRLRSERPDLKVLYMSGYPDDAIARHGVLDFGKHFLQKPFSERTLAAKVREVIGGTSPAARCGRRILMIDDDEQFRELVQHFCRRQGHEFAGVNSAAAALEALAAPSFDVLLVDLNLPGTDGAQVLREIRAAGCRTPAIVLTGDVDSADMHTLRPLGAVLALQKTSEAEPLLQAIEAVAATGGAPPVRL